MLLSPKKIKETFKFHILLNSVVYLQLHRLGSAFVVRFRFYKFIYLHILIVLHRTKLGMGKKKKWTTRAATSSITSI